MNVSRPVSASLLYGCLVSQSSHLFCALNCRPSGKTFRPATEVDHEGGLLLQYGNFNILLVTGAVRLDGSGEAKEERKKMNFDVWPERLRPLLKSARGRRFE